MTGTNQGDAFSQQVGQAGRPDTSANASAGVPGESATPEFVSREELRKELENMKKYSQTLVDKNVGRLDQRVAEAVSKIDQFVELGKGVGQAYSPEQISQMKQAAIQQALTTPVSVSQQSPAQVPPQQEPIPEVTQKALQMMQQARIQVTRDDPEFQFVDEATTDPNVFLASVAKAIEAKRQALSGVVNANPAANPIMAGAGGQPANLQTEYQNQLKTIRRGDILAIDKLQKEFRKRGLDV